MERRIQHTDHLNWPFEQVCDVLERRGPTLLAEATKSAATDADHLVIALEVDLHIFQVNEKFRSTPGLWFATVPSGRA